jgi:putative ABC transport system permease protein
MNVMLVAVTQRTGEIGLLKALGATGATIRTAFLAEAAMLSLGRRPARLPARPGSARSSCARLYPVFPAYPPDWAVLAGFGTALATGMLFGVMPARRAARLDPVQSLAKR